MAQNNISEQLSILREKYRKGLVSVIVGAGFSRNACKEYPLWKDLLYDMVVELYQEEIEKAFLRYRQLHPDSTMNFDEYTKQEVPRIIDKVGYLKMVSEYIARKGYREAIEHYIEERIPYIDVENQQFRFSGKNHGKVIAVEAGNFSAHQKLLEGEKWERIYTTNYDRLLEYAKDIAEKKYTIITKAKELSVSKENASIIKLHGDLYYPKEKRTFMFDGNPHQQYIISEEDYQNYPREHEAFTQLMRISLLQGVFCLIGFSGDDPNFVNWISWVRDVIVTDNGKEDSDEADSYKIFLIGMSKDEPDEIKKLFYENHNIVFVPLLRDDVKTLIKAEDVDEPRDLFCKFFDYLYQENIVTDKLTDSGDSSLSKKYNELWDGVYEVKHTATLPTKFEKELRVDEEKLTQLYALKPWNRIVSYTYRQADFVRETVYKKHLTKPEAKLLLLGLIDTGLTIDGDLIKKIAESGIGEEDTALLNRIVERSKTLMYSDYEGEDTEGTDTYELVLRALFMLDFAKVNVLLNGWKPTKTDIMKKAMLVSLDNKAEGQAMLVEYIGQEPNVKEQYYATRLLNLVENTFPPSHSLERFENANVQDYYKVLTNLTKRVTEKKEKIRRYGDGKNEKVFHIGGVPNKIMQATAVLNFLIEAPAFVSYKNFYTLLSSEDWYHIHQEVFERYPLPVLFFGLQCTDSKIKTRIGQDYAYSDSLAKSCLDDVLKYLLKALLAAETPHFMWESILLIAKELFVSVKPAKWESLFMQFWSEEVLKCRFKEVKNRWLDELDHFVEKALNCLKTTERRQRVIKDLLDHVKEDTGFVINCLYYLHVTPTDMKGNLEMQVAVDRFVREISTPSELNVAGNIYRLLNDSQKALCAQKCMALLSGNKESITTLVYQVSQYFVKDKPEMKAVFIRSICENPLLWKNGVMGENTYGDFAYLKLNDFTNRIYIDQASLLIIYEKLKSSAQELINFTERHKDSPFFSDTDGLLAEMLTFLNVHEKRLKNQSDYDSLRKQVNEAYHKVSGLKNVEDGLLSEYEADVRKSLNYIYGNRDIFSRQEMNRYIDVIINRVLLRNSDGLDLCIVYLRYFLKEGLLSMDNQEQIAGLVRILDRYEKEDLQRCGMDLVMTARTMGKMAVYLSGKEYQSPGIDYWKQFNKTSRFYSNFD